MRLSPSLRFGGPPRRQQPPPGKQRRLPICYLDSGRIFSFRQLSTQTTVIARPKSDEDAARLTAAADDDGRISYREVWKPSDEENEPGEHIIYFRLKPRHEWPSK